MKSKPKQNGSWVYGTHAVQAAFEAGRVKKIICTLGQEKEFKSKVQTEIVHRQVLDKQFPSAVHQGIAAQVNPLPDYGLSDVIDCNRLLVLDQITDPHNFGAILRSAAAFGFMGVLVPKAQSAALTPAAAKAAVGAAELVKVVEINLAQGLQQLQQHGFWVIGLAGEAKTELKDVKPAKKICIVMGSEGEGIRPLVQKQCDELVKINMQSGMESLNVSVATGITLHHFAE